jgi:hypothetical protein
VEDVRRCEGELQQIKAALASGREGPGGGDLGLLRGIISEEAVEGLKFNELLPLAVAVHALARRTLDVEGAEAVAGGTVRMVG